MELIILVTLLVAMVYVGYRVLNKEDDEGRHPLDSVKPTTELKPMPVLTEEIKASAPPTDSAPVESIVLAPPPSPVHETIQEPIPEPAQELKVEEVVKEEVQQPAPPKEKKMAAKKPEPAKKPAPTKAPKKPKK
jgi:hypothetical protein